MKKFFYRVQPSDTLLDVCAKLKAPVFKVIKDNNIRGEILAGDLLYVETFDRALTVKPLESIEEFCLRSGASVQEIYAKNGTIPYLFYGLTIYL